MLMPLVCRHLRPSGAPSWPQRPGMMFFRVWAPFHISGSSWRYFGNEVRTFQSIDSKQPLRASIASCDHLLIILVDAGCCWTRGLYWGEKWTRLWFDLASGGRAVELFVSLMLAYSKFRLLLSLVGQSTNCVKLVICGGENHMAEVSRYHNESAGGLWPGALLWRSIWCHTLWSLCLMAKHKQQSS